MYYSLVYLFYPYLSYLTFGGITPLPHWKTEHQMFVPRIRWGGPYVKNSVLSKCWIDIMLYIQKLTLNVAWRRCQKNHCTKYFRPEQYLWSWDCNDLIQGCHWLLVGVCASSSLGFGFPTCNVGIMSDTKPDDNKGHAKTSCSSTRRRFSWESTPRSDANNSDDKCFWRVFWDILPLSFPEGLCQFSVQ